MGNIARKRRIVFQLEVLFKTCSESSGITVIIIFTLGDEKGKTCGTRADIWLTIDKCYEGAFK